MHGTVWELLHKTLWVLQRHCTILYMLFSCYSVQLYIKEYIPLNWKCFQFSLCCFGGLFKLKS